MGRIMKVEENKAIIARLYKEAFQDWDTSLFDELVAVDFVDHLLNRPDAASSRGPRAFHELYALLRSAFPDLRFEVHDILAEEDKVMVRWMFAGTHDGDFRGCAATGQSIQVEGIAIYRLKDEKIVERWVSTNLDQLAQRLRQSA